MNLIISFGPIAVVCIAYLTILMSYDRLGVKKA